MEYFREFCKQTGLHGWQYMSDAKILGPKNIFWFIILVSSAIGATVLIYYNTKTFQTATFLTTVETMTAPLSEVFFPSITICNINQARKSFFDEIGVYENESLIWQIQSQYLGGSDPNETLTLPPELMKRLRNIEMAENTLNYAMHQKCEDLIIQNKLRDVVSDNSLEFDYDFGTDYGICCWFTPQLNYAELVRLHKIAKASKQPASNSTRLGQRDMQGQWFLDITKGATSGKYNGYIMLLDVETYDYMYYMEGSEGLKVILLFSKHLFRNKC